MGRKKIFLEIIYFIKKGKVLSQIIYAGQDWLKYYNILIKYRELIIMVLNHCESVNNK